MRRYNEDITAVYYVWIDVQYGKEEEKLGGHTEYPFIVFDRSTRAFVIQRGRVVELVNGDWGFEAPTPTDASLREELDATLADLQRKNTTRRDWQVKSILDHRTDGGKTLELQVD